MFHGDKAHGLFWFPYSLHHQKVAAVIKRTLLKWAMANNNMEFPIVRQACFCLFVCLYMYNILANLFFICLFHSFCKSGLQQIDNWSDSIIEQLVLFHRDMFNIEADKEEVDWCLFHIWNNLLYQYSSTNSEFWLFALLHSCTIRTCDILAEVLIWIQFWIDARQDGGLDPVWVDLAERLLKEDPRKRLVVILSSVINHLDHHSC